MSWFRSAINKATEVRGKDIAPNITRTVRNVAQHAGQAVAGGAKLVHDRLAGGKLNSFKNAEKRLDEVALTARKDERTRALARWLAALKEIGKETKTLPSEANNQSTRSEDHTIVGGSDEALSSQSASAVVFYDFEKDGEPMTFREVFLFSRAIENIVTSMILEAPSDDELSLLLDIFGLCLAGGKELHNAIISSIQDLSKAFASYTEEFLIDREDLLQYARDAISGLKLNAEVERLDTEIASLKLQIAEKQVNVGEAEDIDLLQSSVSQNTSGDASLLMNEGYKNTNEVLTLGIKLHDLLKRKEIQLNRGDTEESRAFKIEALNGLIRTLQDWTVEQENKISDNRSQKAAAIKYWESKAQEVSEIEKSVSAEVRALEKRRDELEAELKEVNASLVAAIRRHINTQEEKQQFDKANSEIVAHITNQEEELSRYLAVRNAEAGAGGTCLSFLEDTWKLQLLCREQSEKNLQHAMEEVKEMFLKSLIVNLSYRKVELGLLVNQLKELCNSLKELSDKNAQVEIESDASVADFIGGKRKLQEKYLESEGKAVQILRDVELLKDDLQCFKVHANGNSVDLETKVTDLLESIDQMRRNLESLEKPDLELEKPPQDDSRKGQLRVSWADSVVSPRSSTTPQNVATEELASGKPSEAPEENHSKLDDSSEIKKSDSSPEENHSKLDDSSEIKKSDSSPEETAGWEFDELEEDLKKEMA